SGRLPAERNDPHYGGAAPLRGRRRRRLSASPPDSPRRFRTLGYDRRAALGVPPPPRVAALPPAARRRSFVIEARPTRPGGKRRERQERSRPHSAGPRTRGPHLARAPSATRPRAPSRRRRVLPRRRRRPRTGATARSR